MVFPLSSAFLFHWLFIKRDTYVSISFRQFRFRKVILKDIEAMKAIAITQRGSAKDFVDLFFLLKKSNHNFKDILKFVIKKYDVENRYEYHLKTSFVYFDDAEKEKDNIMLIKNMGKIHKITNKEWKDIKQFFYEFIK